MAKLTPYDWQLRDLASLRANNYTGLIAIEAGGGKSLTATLAIKESAADVVLIIAPKSTHRTAWIPTVRDNADRTPRIIGNDNKATKAALFDFILGEPGIYLVSPQFVTRADTTEWAGDMLIIDEVHQVATPRSKAQRKISGFTPRETTVALAPRFRMRLALSGTPMRQQFTNMWSTMRTLWPEYDQRGQIADGNLYFWQNDRQEFVTVYTNQRDTNGQPKTVKQFMSEKHPGRLISEMPCVILHKRRERCCASHPEGFLSTDEPQVIERVVELTAPQRRSIKEMEEHMMTFLQDNPLVAEISLTQQQRIRQLTLGEATVRETDEGKSTIEFPADCKSPFLDETFHILENLPEDENVVVYVESRRFAAVAVERLNAAGYKAAEYSGVTKADLNEFGKTYRVLVGVVSAIGTGTDSLQHAASTEIWLEQPVSLTMKSQSEARLDRMGGTKQVQRYVLFDDLDVQRGRFNENILKQLVINRSLRKVA